MTTLQREATAGYGHGERVKTQSQEMQAALNRLELEAIHFRNTGVGWQFLLDAIENLLRVDRKEFS